MENYFAMRLGFLHKCKVPVKESYTGRYLKRYL